jgi:hypothetical protein
MKFNIAVIAAVLTGIVTSMTGALAPSARSLQELRAADTVSWNRISGSICDSCRSEKTSVRSVLTDPVAVLAAAPRPSTNAIGYNPPQPTVRAAGSYRRYASLRRRDTQRYAAKIRKPLHRYAGLKYKRRLQFAELHGRDVENAQEESIRPEWNTIAMDTY